MKGLSFNYIDRKNLHKSAEMKIILFSKVNFKFNFLIYWSGSRNGFYVAYKIFGENIYKEVLKKRQ